MRCASRPPASAAARSQPCPEPGASTAQQWTRGFANDGRIENRSTLTALTRQGGGTLEVRFLGGGQVGQNWHEHAA